MIRDELRVITKQRATVLRLEIALDGHQAFLADLHQHVVQALEQLDIIVALVARSLDEAECVDERSFGDLGRIARQKGAECSPDDDQHFRGMPQRKDLAALECESGDDAAQDDDGTDYLNHRVAGVEETTAVSSVRSLSGIYIGGPGATFT